MTGLPSRWEALKEWLTEQPRMIHRRDHQLGNADRFALVLQVSLAGSKLALLGKGILPEMESLTGDSLLGRFMARVRELRLAVCLDDPYNLLDVKVWRERDMMGRW